jgi:GTPase
MATKLIQKRELREDRYLDIRFAVCGNVGSGKSTLVGVLCFGACKDEN